jgi:hypothetical protein
MPKPPHTFRHIRRQASFADAYAKSRQDVAASDADRRRRLDDVMHASRLDGHRIRALRTLILQIKQGEPISEDDKRYKTYVQALEQIHDLAKWSRELADLDRSLVQHANTILRVPAGSLSKVETLHTPSFLTACLSLVILVDRLLLTRRR